MSATRIVDDTFDIVEAQVRVLAPEPLAAPFVDATMGPFEEYGLAALTLRDGDGLEGESLATGLPFLDSILIPTLLRAGRRPYSEIYHALYWSIRNAGFRGPAASALGAMDMALHDLAARRAGQPLWRLLGATRTSVEVYGSGGGTNLEDGALLDEMTSLAAQGFGTVKMKVGTGFGRAMEADVRRVRAVRAAIGPAVRLAVDANQAWTPDEALAFTRQIADQDIAWFEEPVHSADTDALRRYARDAQVVAAAGESETSARCFPALADAGARHLQPMPLKLSSVAEWMAVRDLAARRGLAVSCPGFPWVSATLAATGGDGLLCEYLVPVLGFVPQLLVESPRLHRGRIELEETPGLGVRLDWTRLERAGRIVENRRFRPEDVA